MKTLTKALLGTGAAAAAMVSAVQPAVARDRGGIDVGDIIAGAVILGGIAAVTGSIGNDNDRYGTYGSPYDYNDRYGDRYDNSRYGYTSGNPRQAVESCVRAAEQSASRYSYGRADVTDVRDIDRNSRGYTVRGRIAVNSQGRGYRNGDPRYGRGWGNDYRGWNDNLRGYDAGSFKCRVEYGRVVDLDFSGIRGL
ncbi:MAG TPA: hypothetical protein VM055_06585 [Novosphingobium sp.]|nr:hypothetical protein [Novosphingobium sp.]